MPTKNKPVYSFLSSDPDLRKIVELFVNEMPARIAKLESSLATGSWFELLGDVHQLRGSAGSHGFSKLPPVAAEVEKLIKSEASDTEIRNAAKNLISLCHLITAAPEPH
ncbi:MAG: Hpt domain-containing protein [Thermoguttaceae bacterium]